MIARILVAAGLLFALPAAAQQIYRWVDANGNVNFSSTPPPDARGAEAVDLPPTPSAEEVEAARQREQSLQQLGDQLSKERQDREAQRAEELKAAREEAALQQPVETQADSGDDWGYGWWIPGYPHYRPHPHPRPRPPWPERPMPPGPGRDPTAPPDHPAYWPREPVLPPVAKPGRPVAPTPLPSLPPRR